MLAVLRIVRKIAPTDVGILVTGETGTGKEVLARAIHDHSRRSTMPFLALNCAAVPKDLLESQLFGHRKGAFSGATENHQGIVRAANGGTLFLDEIGELPLDMQAKLLRFLEMGEVHPVGDNHPVKVNVRLIFATNGDLEEAVAQNRFRQDLYYRLNVIPIKVPPLRERREEIPVLANLFAQRFAGEFAKDPVRFSSGAMELLIMYSWPGNIRQLANEVRRLTALAESGASIVPEHLSPQLQAQKPRALADFPKGTSHIPVRIDQSLESATAQLESEMIKYALRQAGGRVSAAASTLGISRKGLYLKRLRLGLADFGEKAH
jgi:DNA-binding NtrC family response regulator